MSKNIKSTHAKPGRYILQNIASMWDCCDAQATNKQSHMVKEKIFVFEHRIPYSSMIVILLCHVLVPKLMASFSVTP